jgi:hypothetical protein
MSGYLTINDKLYFIRFFGKARKKTLFEQSNFFDNSWNPEQWPWVSILDSWAGSRVSNPDCRTGGPNYRYLTSGQGSSVGTPDSRKGVLSINTVSRTGVLSIINTWLQDRGPEYQYLTQGQGSWVWIPDSRTGVLSINTWLQDRDPEHQEAGQGPWVSIPDSRTGVLSTRSQDVHPCVDAAWLLPLAHLFSHHNCLDKKQCFKFYSMKSWKFWPTSFLRWHFSPKLTKGKWVIWAQFPHWTNDAMIVLSIHLDCGMSTHFMELHRQDNFFTVQKLFSYENKYH